MPHLPLHLACAGKWVRARKQRCQDIGRCLLSELWGPRPDGTQCTRLVSKPSRPADCGKVTSPWIPPRIRHLEGKEDGFDSVLAGLGPDPLRPSPSCPNSPTPAPGDVTSVTEATSSPVSNPLPVPSLPSDEVERVEVACSGPQTRSFRNPSNVGGASGGEGPGSSSLGKADWRRLHHVFTGTVPYPTPFRWVGVAGVSCRNFLGVL